LLLMLLLRCCAALAGFVGIKWLFLGLQAVVAGCGGWYHCCVGGLLSLIWCRKSLPAQPLSVAFVAEQLLQI